MPEPTLDQLPNLFVLGAAKAGTTSLHAYLAQHPAIYPGAEKEPHFFDNWTYKQGPQYYVETFYPDTAGYAWRMDATPGYFHLPHRVIPRMKNVYGDAPLKFIVTLREPVSRAWSHYLHRLAQGAETLNFEEAIAVEEARAPDGEWDQYFHDGLYARQLRAWFKEFPREQFFILLQEDLHNDASQVLHNICTFLDIDPNVQIDTSGHLNQSSISSPLAMKILRHRLPFPLGDFLSPFIKVRPRDVVKSVVKRLPRDKPLPPDETIARLHAAYRQDTIELGELIDRDLSHWLRETELHRVKRA